MKTNLEQQVEVNKSLLNQQSILRVKYDDVIKVNQEVQQRQKDLTAEIELLHNAILTLCPNKQLQSIDSVGKAQSLAPTNVRINTISPALSSTPPPQMITSRIMSVPTAAALKQGVGFPLNNLRKDETGRILSTQCINNDELLNECGICKKCNDQHLLAKCDTCHLYYHLGCLNPPLTRHPKKSKLYAWQCSECDNDDSGAENIIMPRGPRRSRIRYSKDGLYHTDLNDSFGSESSLVGLSKSDENLHFINNSSNSNNLKISNGTDIALSEHELEEHVKETLNVEVATGSSNSVIMSEKEHVINSEKPSEVKREKKSKTKNPAKSKGNSNKKSATVEVPSIEVPAQLNDTQSSQIMSNISSDDNNINNVNNKEETSNTTQVIF